VPSGGGSLATFVAPLFNNNTKTIRYWINDAKNSATFYNRYLFPQGEAAGTANSTVISSVVKSEITFDNPQWFPTYKSGVYYFCNSPGATSTNAALGNGTLRVSPWVVTKAVTITRIGLEFTAAGEANSVIRLGIYADDGTGFPTGAPVLDAGTISTGTGNAGNVATGGTPGVYEITVSQVLNPGVYWVGAAVQAAPTTQPTIRVTAGTSLVFPVPSTAIPGVNAALGGFQMAAAGALPTWSGSGGGGSGVPRIFFKTA
jgi:hypothetical protein